MTAVPPPLALLAEVTHRCPMRCLYCSNPLALADPRQELDTDTWRRVLDEAAGFGVLQVHLSGGEPAARSDLEDLVRHAAAAGLYTNLITSGLSLGADRLRRLAASGLDHVQLSVQDSDAEAGDAVGGLPGAHARKLAVAGWVREAGLALTLNAVVHRGNADRVGRLIDLALSLSADRIEIAHAQYYGWALLNRSVLMPTRAQVDEVTRLVASERERLKGRMVIDYVVPDYFARFPKPCMGGWGRAFLVVDPVGRALPCHAATTIPGLAFNNVRDRDLAWIWTHSAAFNRYRGTGWLPAPCAGCDRRELDWGGCRCQAHALTGDAGNTDPVCEKSPLHQGVLALADRESAGTDAPATHRAHSRTTLAR